MGLVTHSFLASSAELVLCSAIQVPGAGKSPKPCELSYMMCPRPCLVFCHCSAIQTTWSTRWTWCSGARRTCRSVSPSQPCSRASHAAEPASHLGREAGRQRQAGRQPAAGREGASQPSRQLHAGSQPASQPFRPGYCPSDSGS